MPDVYVRLREGGERDGLPVPADGRVRLTPVRVPDSEAWVTSAPTVLDVVGGVAEPVSISAGRWMVDAVSAQWARRWTLDLEESPDPVNLATLTPVEASAPLPWAPTEAELVEVRSALDEMRDLAGAGTQITITTDADGAYSLTRNDMPVPVTHEGEGAYQIGV